MMIEIPIKRREPVIRWVPCSERLPGCCDVLACDKDGNIIIGYVAKDKESETGYSAINDDLCMDACVAWMPLPEPWKGEEK
ncbi:MAG: hypothetical protein J6S49_08750 [Erysipelotrichaceae bacterium]|nr:hypothetical protein [Erysipelotrichaceae bacterium]